MGDVAEEAAHDVGQSFCRDLAVEPTDEDRLVRLVLSVEIVGVETPVGFQPRNDFDL